MKRNLLYIFLVIVLSSHYSVLTAQKSKKDSVIELNTVDINDQRLLQVTVGLKIETIDSLTLSHYISSSLAEILSSNSALYLKSYGSGGIAEISIRGTAPDQNAIFWNGFNINVSNIGLSDFALVPGSFFNKIEILYGGSSSVYGNGIIGGSIHLENEPVFKNMKSYDINSSVGSFNTFNENLRAVIANSHLCSITAINLNSAENNFPYINTTEALKPEERQINAQSDSHGLLQQFSILNSQSSIIDVAVWYQYKKTHIPPSLTESLSNANQTDESLRSTFQWKKTTNNISFIAKGAYFCNYEHYINPQSSINSKIFNNTGIIDLELNKHFFCHECMEALDSGKTYTESNIQNNSFDLNAGVNYALNEANLSAYNGSKQRYDAAIFASISHKFAPGNWTADINLRQELTQGYNVPLTPSFGMEGRIWKFISGRLNVSQNFRIPTLNELYWQPGGNLNLKPETSFNQEAGIIINLSTQRKQNPGHKAELSITAFNSNINNLIQWVPDKVSGQTYTPENIEQVHSRGLELKGKYSFFIANCKLSFNLAYSYTRSTNEKKLSSLDNSVDKQLIYVPVNDALASVSLDYKTFDINYSQNYIDSRYTLRDNSAKIPGYTLGSCYISKHFKFHHTGFGLQFNIDNIWNVSYVAIENMPMPGRFLRLSINFKIS